MTQQGTFAWAAMTSDGAYALTNSIDPSSSNPAINNSSAGSATSSFWQFGPAPTAGTITGLPGGVAAGYPSYAPDDKYVAYIDATGSTNNVKGPIVVAAYNAATQTFSEPDHAGHARRAGSASATRSSSRTTAASSSRPKCARARATASWSRATARGASSGGSTPPAPPKPGRPGDPQRQGVPAARPEQPRRQHRVRPAGLVQRDRASTTRRSTTSPRSCPIAAGGYAWVVFTSRRMYGSELAVGALAQSWPPDYDTTRPRAGDREEALGRGDRPERARGHRPEPPGLLPARAGDPRRQLARLLGARPVQGERGVMPVGRPVLQRLLRAERRRRGAHLLEHAAELRGRCRTSAPPPPTAATRPTSCINGFCAQQGAQ